MFGASNVELVTKTRSEHLSEEDKAKFKSAKTPLQSFLGIAEVEEKAPTNVPPVSMKNLCFIFFSYSNFR